MASGKNTGYGNVDNPRKIIRMPSEVYSMWSKHSGVGHNRMTIVRMFLPSNLVPTGISKQWSENGWTYFDVAYKKRTKRSTVKT